MIVSTINLVRIPLRLRKAIVEKAAPLVPLVYRTDWVNYLGPAVVKGSARSERSVVAHAGHFKASVSEVIPHNTYWWSREAAPNLAAAGVLRRKSDWISHAKAFNRAIVKVPEGLRTDWVKAVLGGVNWQGGLSSESWESLADGFAGLQASLEQEPALDRRKWTRAMKEVLADEEIKLDSRADWRRLEQKILWRLGGLN